MSRALDREDGRVEPGVDYEIRITIGEGYVHANGMYCMVCGAALELVDIPIDEASSITLGRLLAMQCVDCEEDDGPEWSDDDTRPPTED